MIKISQNNKEIFNLFVEKSFLGLSVAFAVLSVIPPFRLIGNICLRVTSLGMSGTTIASGWKHSNTTEKVILCAKAALALAGIVGVVIHSPAILAAALIADMAINLFEGFKAGMNNKAGDLFKHFLFFKIEALILVGIAIGSAPILMQAALLSAIVMLAFAGYSVFKALKDKQYHNLFDAVAFGVLSAVSIINFNQLRSFRGIKTSTTLSGKNESDKILKIYDKEGHLLLTVQPGESYQLKIPGDVNRLYYRTYKDRLSDSGMWEFKSGNKRLEDAVKMAGLTSPCPGTGLEVIV